MMSTYESPRNGGWEKRWNKTINVHPARSQSRTISTPTDCNELAEFIGIMIGDGGISKYQCSITLNTHTDSEYIDFVIGLIHDLFKLQPSKYVRHSRSVTAIVVSRVALTKFLTEKGLPIGNKILNRIDIPDWIKGDKNFLISCVRGLIDTDGSIFNHRYKSKGKEYSYKKLGFTSVSACLRDSVANALNSLDIKARISGNDVRLDSTLAVKRYLKIIGTNNPKHLKRYTS